MNQPCDFGLIGLAVMGENLALNIESRGYSVAVHNRTTSKVDEFVAGRDDVIMTRAARMHLTKR